MEFLFNVLGGIFGYILWFAFYLVKNFGVAIIIFTFIVKILLFPFSIKQQKSMASNARFQEKQREIMEKYKGDRTKANEELSKLMEKENISPTAGCFPMIAPMIVMFGVWYAVRNPLSNVLHIASDKVTTAMNSIATLPGIGTSINSQYGEISIVKYFSALQKYFVDGSGNALFNTTESANINEFSKGFDFLGLDLLATPSQSSFSSMMWLIPVLCFATYVLSMLFMQKMNGTKMQGCMLVMIFGMPLFSAWIAYSVPGAVGFYWISSTVLGFVQSLIMNKFYSPSIMEAKAEAERVVLRREQEAGYEFIDVPDEAVQSEVKQLSDGRDRQKGKSSGKKKSKKSSNNNSSYQGKKK
ncbi:MAG: YidC/Oxa1 family membrane protein insertase [Clostridia bacterium]|nr:YidC/Oxa1 family membrane protein insertase [Clostridia bacterium]